MAYPRASLQVRVEMDGHGETTVLVMNSSPVRAAPPEDRYSVLSPRVCSESVCAAMLRLSPSPGS